MYNKYEDERLQEIEDMVIRKIKRTKDMSESDKKELIEELRLEGIEEYMGFIHLVNNQWVENTELKEKVFKSMYQKRKIVNEYLNDILT